MFLLDGVWVASATDLVTALSCEYQLLARRAEKAELVAPLDVPADELLARAADLGISYEKDVLATHVAAVGEGAPGGVVSIDQPSTKDRDELVAAHERTRQAMADGAEVVYQGAFFDGLFHGLADFIVRTPGPDGVVRYEPADTKLARHARVEAMVQLATYAFQIEQMGQPAPREVHLWLGDGTRTHHRYADLRPILLDRTARLRELLDAPTEVPVWGSTGIRWCGWCDHCRAAAEARRDVLLVAGVRVDQRRTLAEAGIATIEDLASSTTGPASIKEPVFAKLQAQAELQAAQDASVSDDHPDGIVSAELADPAAIALVPLPNPGDVFFDFEGDPLHVSDGWTDLGLEYLFGTLTHGVEGTTAYWPLWAHDRHGEREALETFLDWLTARRCQPGFEGLHVYHYAPYEITALKKLVQRYGTRADELDTLLREGVFVDLYGIVRRSVRVSQRSYSIKKLEPLYMGDELRESEVTGGAESIVWYAEYQTLRDAGDDAGAAARLEELRSYNEYDCLSTLRLRDWLIGLDGAERPNPYAIAEAPEPESPKPNPAHELAERLTAPLIDLPPASRTPTQQATALVAAALEYHRREVLPFWWDHFRRVGAPVEDWEHDGEMIVLTGAQITVVEDWNRPAKKWERTFEAIVELPGSFKLSPNPDRQMFAIHDAPLPSQAAPVTGTERGFAKTVTWVTSEPAGEHCRIRVVESLPARITELEPEHQAFPAALSADSALEGKGAAKAIFALASSDLVGDGSTLAPHPALDLLQRIPPRLRTGPGLPPVDGEVADAIIAAVRDLDRSYLAVQGPPGTGKSTTGAAAIAGLMELGWKIGVVAQSHRTVEGFLDKVVERGVPADRVLKRDHGGGEHRGTPASDAELLAAATSPAAGAGTLIGGTVWDFVNDKRIPAASLDLLVIDEAGQFSLADTLAVSRVAPRLLLLGDPQQLSQVSQASHPEPVAESALGWLAGTHDTLPPELGYFLDHTYRMRPELSAAVSHLAYDDRLSSDPCTRERHIEGVEPGVRTLLVDHQSNRAASAEEVDRIVVLVRDLLGRTWTDPSDRRSASGRPLDQVDLVVVAPFNAQVNRLRARFDDEGWDEIPVGTVDKFQGREAAVVIVSMAASSAASSSRGAGFLLSRHRLNVAISRAQHTAFLVHAPQLTDFVPRTPAGLVRLGAFLAVSQGGR